MSEPTWRLPACPVCSSIVTVERPIWRLARHHSRHEGRKFYTFTGCKHAGEISTPGHHYDDPELIACVEDAWERRVAQLFEAKVKGWSAKAIDDFRRNLNDQHSIPGTTEEFKF